MFPQRRIVASVVPRIVAQLRASAATTRQGHMAAVPRRLMSSAPDPGPNATAQHADAAKLAAEAKAKFLKQRQGVKQHAAETADLWKKISLYVVPVALTLAGYNAWILWEEHWEHFAHEPPLEERVEYSYQNIRTKNYQWGDGDKTLFWNDKVNYHNKNKGP